MLETPASSSEGFRREWIKSSDQTLETGKVDRQTRVRGLAAYKRLKVCGHRERESEGPGRGVPSKDAQNAQREPFRKSLLNPNLV